MNLRLSPDEPLLTNNSTMHDVYKKLYEIVTMQYAFSFCLMPFIKTTGNKESIVLTDMFS